MPLSVIKKRRKELDTFKAWYGFATQFSKNKILQLYESSIFTKHIELLHLKVIMQEIGQSQMIIIDPIKYITFFHDCIFHH